MYRNLILGIAGIASIATAAVLSFQETSNWGWFLFVGFLFLLWLDADNRSNRKESSNQE